MNVMWLSLKTICLKMCSLFFEEDVVAKITLRKNNSLKLLYFTLQDIKQSTIVPVMLFRFAKVILVICLNK